MFRGIVLREFVVGQFIFHPLESASLKRLRNIDLKHKMLARSQKTLNMLLSDNDTFRKKSVTL